MRPRPTPSPEASPTDPFGPSVGRSARDREQALIDFLAEQARQPDAQRWQELAQGSAADAGYYALLLSNLLEGRAPRQAAILYEVAAALLADQLTATAFEQWLRTRQVDVPRLAASLDQALWH